MGAVWDAPNCMTGMFCPKFYKVVICARYRNQRPRHEKNIHNSWRLKDTLHMCTQSTQWGPDNCTYVKRGTVQESTESHYVSANKT